MSLKAYLAATGLGFERARNVNDWRMVRRLLSAEEVRLKYSRDSQLRLQPVHGDPENLRSGYYWGVEARHPCAQINSDASSEIVEIDAPPAFVCFWNCSAEPSPPAEDNADSAANDTPEACAPDPDAILLFSKSE